MSHLTILMAVGITVVATAVGMAVRRIIGAWLKYCGKRIVTCPEHQKPAGVIVDWGHAAATAWRGNPDLRLSGCTRWPQRASCSQTCLSQIHSSPEDCRVSRILASWYDDKYCVWCGQPVGEEYWTTVRPALLTAGPTLLTWTEIPIDELPGTLAAAQPVCFGCYTRRVVAPGCAAPLPTGTLGGHHV